MLGKTGCVLKNLHNLITTTHYVKQVDQYISICLQSVFVKLLRIWREGVGEMCSPFQLSCVLDSITMSVESFSVRTFQKYDSKGIHSPSAFRRRVNSTI